MPCVALSTLCGSTQVQQFDVMRATRGVLLFFFFTVFIGCSQIKKLWRSWWRALWAVVAPVNTPPSLAVTFAVSLGSLGRERLGGGAVAGSLWRVALEDEWPERSSRGPGERPKMFWVKHSERNQHSQPIRGRVGRSFDLCFYPK